MHDKKQISFMIGDSFKWHKEEDSCFKFDIVTVVERKGKWVKLQVKSSGKILGPYRTFPIKTPPSESMVIEGYDALFSTDTYNI